MFKIVQTIEKGKKEVTIVPSAWEDKGWLSWPKVRADKLVIVADSKPDNNWFMMKCKLKRNHLINYAVAEEEMERMLEKDETEQEEVLEEEITNKKCRTGVPPRNQYDNFNHLAKECMVRYFLLNSVTKLTKR